MNTRFSNAAIIYDVEKGVNLPGRSTVLTRETRETP